MGVGGRILIKPYQVARPALRNTTPPGQVDSGKARLTVTPARAASPPLALTLTLPLALTLALALALALALTLALALALTLALIL